MKLNFSRHIVLSVAALLLIAPLSHSKGLKSPDEFYKTKTFPASSSKKTESRILNALKNPFLAFLNAGLTVYQYGVSNLTATNCSMYPSCSHYSREALKKHGAIIGLMMTTDRLMHEAEELERGKLIKKGNRYYIADPLSNNDFWWTDEKK